MAEDLRKYTRNVLRKNDTDIIMPDNKGGYVKIDGVKVSPEFASVVDKLITEKRNKDIQEYENNKRRLDILNLIEVYEEPTVEEEDDELIIEFNPSKTWAPKDIEILFDFGYDGEE